MNTLTHVSRVRVPCDFLRSLQPYGWRPSLGVVAWLAQHPDLVSRRVGDETIIVPLRRQVVDLEAIFVLNETASKVWEWLPDSGSIGDLVARMVALFDIDEVNARADIEATIDEWKAEGLVEDLAGKAPAGDG